MLSISFFYLRTLVRKLRTYSEAVIGKAKQLVSLNLSFWSGQRRAGLGPWLDAESIHTSTGQLFINSYLPFDYKMVHEHSRVMCLYWHSQSASVLTGCMNWVRRSEVWNDYTVDECCMCSLLTGCVGMCKDNPHSLPRSHNKKQRFLLRKAIILFLIFWCTGWVKIGGWG